MRIETTTDNQRIVGLFVPNAAVEAVLQGPYVFPFVLVFVFPFVLLIGTPPVKQEKLRGFQSELFEDYL